MKKIIFLSCILFVQLTKAQDVIFIFDGTTIESKVIAIESEVIKYKLWNSEEDSIYSIPKTEVIMINYANGNRDMFVNNESATQTPLFYDANEQLEYDKESFSKLRLGNKLLTEREAFLLLSYDNENIYKETWVGANRQRNVGNALFFSGFALLVSSDALWVYNVLNNNNFFIEFLTFSGHMCGTGMFVVGVIFKTIGQKRMDWVLDTYNCKIRLNNQTSLSVMPTPLGLGLQLNF